MLKNTAGQSIIITARNAYGIPKLGDAANITALIAKDGALTTAATATAHPNEIGSGAYSYPLSQSETNCNNLALIADSTTSGVTIPIVIVRMLDSGAIPASEVLDLARDILNDRSGSRWEPTALMRNLRLGIREVYAKARGAFAGSSLMVPQSSDDDIQVDGTWIMALANYIAWMCFGEDSDQANQQRAAACRATFDARINS